MAIIDTKETSGTGFKKTIDVDSMEMILEMTQVSQYKFPHHSAIRETTSNGVDSITERDLARDILLGKEKESDHYDMSLGNEGQLKGSNFDKSYYNLNFLSTDPITYIKYFENTETRDRVVIADNGVGLGGKRLEKSFNPGFSSKRKSKDTLGSFGINGPTNE